MTKYLGLWLFLAFIGLFMAYAIWTMAVMPG